MKNIRRHKVQKHTANCVNHSTAWEMNINVEVIIIHDVMWQVAVTPTGAVGATKGADIAVTERCVARWRHHTVWRHVTGPVGTLQWQEGEWQGDVILYRRHVTGCSGAYWGNGCTRKCGHCSDGEVCDKVTGNCSSCSVGWVPPLCDQGVCLFS